MNKTAVLVLMLVGMVSAISVLGGYGNCCKKMSNEICVAGYGPRAVSDPPCSGTERMASSWVDKCVSANEGHERCAAPQPVNCINYYTVVWLSGSCTSVYNFPITNTVNVSINVDGESCGPCN